MIYINQPKTIFCNQKLIDKNLIDKKLIDNLFSKDQDFLYHHWSRHSHVGT